MRCFPLPISTLKFPRSSVGEQRLTLGWTVPGRQYREPAWSADGTRLAYVYIPSNADESTAEIATRDHTNSNEIIVTDEPGTPPLFTPAWSPDGQRLAAYSPVPDTIVTMKMDGTDIVSVATGSNPTWSPDGTKIAFDQSSGPGSDIWMANATGGGEVRLTTDIPDARLPRWSSEGGRITFIGTKGDSASDVLVLGPALPSLTTGGPSTLDGTSAVMTGVVNNSASGQPAGSLTSYHFEWRAGTDGEGWRRTPSRDAARFGPSTPVTEAISGLSRGATYHYRLVGVGPGGTTHGAERTFRVPMLPIARTTTPGRVTARTAFSQRGHRSRGAPDYLSI
jgi:dipeptidyl aminopeptidase/acylaminoacyl peptidase